MTSSVNIRRPRVIRIKCLALRKTLGEQCEDSRRERSDINLTPRQRLIDKMYINHVMNSFTFHLGSRLSHGLAIDDITLHTTILWASIYILCFSMLTLQYQTRIVSMPSILSTYR